MTPPVALVSRAHKAFAVPFHPGLAGIVPEGQPFDHPEHGSMLLLPHTSEVTRLARNFDFRVPAPIISQYDWGNGTPYRTQKLTAALLTMNRRAYVLSEMGTGKTRAALFAYDFMRLTKQVRKILIIAPLSTLSPVWDREMLLYFPHLSVGIVYGSRNKRQKVLSTRSHDAFLINPDGIETVLPQLVADKEIDVVLIDELATFRNAGTARWKALAAVVAGRPWVWGMTGSPTPNAPTDAWAQCRLITPNTVTKRLRPFRNETMYQISQFKWVAKRGANEIVNAAMQPAVRFTRDECSEIPPATFVSRETHLSNPQQHAYTQLMRHSRASYLQGEVTAVNEGVLFSKLLQIAAGWVYTTKKGVVGLDPCHKLDAVREIIDEASEKVIVFADFTEVARNLFSILSREYGNVAYVDGSTPKHARDQIFIEFQKPSGPRILVAHPMCVSHGLTLTLANIIVWYCLTTSLDTYEQACARITRMGQLHKQLIIHLIGSSIEKKLYARLRQKKAAQGALLELFENGEGA